MTELERGELEVTVNYIKIAQWIKMRRYYDELIENHLQECCLKQNGKRLERRIAGEDRRNDPSEINIR